MNLPDHFQFSQSSLQDYTECARRFELRYLKRLRWPAVESQPVRERERHMQRGADFHHLVHRHLMGIDADALTASITDDDLRQWWLAYLDSPYAAGTNLVQRHPEISLIAPLGKARLLAKYDLLALCSDGRIQIIDWKTTARKTPRSILETHLQTVVYRYLLVESGAFLNGGNTPAPGQIEMIYWFAVAPDEPEHFPYSVEQHHTDRETLTRLIEEIDQRSVFDLTTDTSRCRFCTYRSLCDRGVTAGDFHADEWTDADPDALDTDFSIDFDQVAEIEF